MNKELYTTPIEKKIKTISVVEGEKLVIELEDEVLEITSYHGQDCCEHVYADFSSLSHYKDKLENYKLDFLTIKGVEKMGFLMVFGDVLKVFVPCYNVQNGYYSDRLSLVIKRGETETTLDLNDFVEDKIN